MSQHRLSRLTNPFVTCESSFGGYFWVGSDSVLRDCLWVKRVCVGWRIHSSPVKGVSRATSEWAATQFSLTHYESTGAVWVDESIRHMWKQFRGYFWVGSDSVFLDILWVNRGCVGWRIHSSSVKAVSRAISERAATQIFMTVYES